MKESIFEQIRNKLSTINFFMDAVKPTIENAEKGSIVDRAYESLEDIKSLLNKAEKKCNCDE